MENELPEALRDPWVRNIIGRMPRPGGPEAMGRAAAFAGIEKQTRVLDAGCARGASAVFLAKTLGCRVLGLTPDATEVAAAQEEARRMKVERVAAFAQGDLLTATLAPESFDVVLLESTLSRSARREDVVAAAVRLLVPGGRLLLADVAVEGDLPLDAAAFLGATGLRGGLPSLAGYARLVEAAGLAVKTRVPVPEALPVLLGGINAKMGPAEFALNLGFLPITPRVFAQLRQMLSMAEGLAGQGVLMFLLLVAEKGRD